MNTKLITEPVGIRADAPALSVTFRAATLFTRVPSAIPGPKTDIPAVMPAVAPALPNVKVGLAAAQSAVVVAALGRIGSLGMVTKVMGEPPGTSAVMAVLSVMFGEFTACTVVPNAIFAPNADIPTLIPAVLVRLRIFPDGASPTVFACTGRLMKLKVTGVVTAPDGAMLKVTAVVVSLLVTTVLEAMPVPLTVMPTVMLSLAAVAAKVNVVALAAKIPLGDAVIVELPELNVMAVLGDTPPGPSPGFNVMVVMTATCVTTVPGAMFVPLTGIPMPTPIAPPSNVSVAPVVPVGTADDGGMMKP